MTEERANEIAMDRLLNGEGPFRIERRLSNDGDLTIYGISRDGWTILHLIEGSSRNIATIEAIVDILNKNAGENDETI